MVRSIKPKLGDKVEVHWWDATDESGYPGQRLYLRKSLGWFIYEGVCTGSGFAIITIGATDDGDGEYDDQLIIPKGWVKKWHKL